MSKRLYLLAIILLASANLFAQGIRVPGYVIKANDDTLRGYLIDRRDDWQVDEIQYATSPDGKTETFPVTSIKSFYLQTYDVFYKSVVLEIDMKPVDLNHLENGPARTLVLDTLLIQRVVAGPISLYKYEGRWAKKHFFVEKGDELVELPFVRYQTSQGIVNVTTFRETLRSITLDCSQAIPIPVDYAERPLSSFIRKYNTCISGKREEKRKAGLKVTAGLLGGVGMAHISLSPPKLADDQQSGTSTTSQAQPYDGDYGYTKTVSGGAFVEFVPKKNSGRSRLGLQMFYTLYSEVSYKSPIGTYYLGALSTYEVGTGYRYIFTPGKKFSPYVKADVNLMFLTGQAKSFLVMHKLGMSLSPAFGILISDRIGIDARYIVKNLGSDIGRRVPLSGFQVALSCSIFK